MKQVLSLFRGEHGNAYYLLANSIAVAGLGFLFWFLLTHLLSADTVGAAASVTSLGTLLGVASLLGLEMTVIEYWHRHSSKVRLLQSSVVTVSIAAIVVVATFVFLSPWVAPTTSSLIVGPRALAVIAFGIGVAIIALITNVFIAGQRADLALVTNTILGVTKIVFGALGGILWGWFGVLLGWVAAQAIGLGVVFLCLINQVLPRPFAALAFDFDIFSSMLGVSAANYVASLFTNASNFLLPLMIFEYRGGAASAYFFGALAIASIIFFIPSAFSLALYADRHIVGSRNRRNILARIGRAYGALAPAVALTILFSHPLLRILGKSYADEGASVLEIFAISALFMAVTSFFSVILRMEGRLIELIVFVALLNSGVLVVAYLLLTRSSADGLAISIGFMGVQAIGSAYAGGRISQLLSERSRL